MRGFQDRLNRPLWHLSTREFVLNVRSLCVFRANPITRFAPIRSAVSEFSITPQAEALSA